MLRLIVVARASMMAMTIGVTVAIIIRPSVSGIAGLIVVESPTIVVMIVSPLTGTVVVVAMPASILMRSLSSGPVVPGSVLVVAVIPRVGLAALLIVVVVVTTLRHCGRSQTCEQASSGNCADHQPNTLIVVSSNHYSPMLPEYAHAPNIIVCVEASHLGSDFVQVQTAQVACPVAIKLDLPRTVDVVNICREN